MMNGALRKDPKRKEEVHEDVTMDGMGAEFEQEGKKGGDGGDRMEIDSRGHGRGQSEEMIAAQQRRQLEATRGLWSSRGGGGQPA